MPTIAIVGASSNQEKFGNKCVRAYQQKGWKVVAIHPKESQVEGLAVLQSLGQVKEKVDRVALYVPPAAGVGVLDEVAKLAGAELIVNPGTESPELLTKARTLKLKFREACAIRDIGVDPNTL